MPTFSVRCSETDMGKIRAQASLAGLSVSEYVRTTVLGEEASSARPYVALATEMRELRARQDQLEKSVSQGKNWNA